MRFLNTHLPPIVRLGDTADPIMKMPRNTAVVVAHTELVRPVIVRTAPPERVAIEFKRPAVRRLVRRRPKRAAR